MAARVVKRLPEGDDWTYELKFDGYRALIIKDEQRAELRSRKNKDLAGMYPGIAAAALRSTYREAKRCRSIRSSMRAEARRGAWPGCTRDVGFYGITARANTVEAVSGNNKIMSDTDAPCEGRSQCLGIKGLPVIEWVLSGC